MDRQYSSMNLGQAGPSEVLIFSKNHDEEFRLHLTELHESTHFYLINNTIVGNVQKFCDQIFSMIEQSSARPRELARLGMSEVDLLDLYKTYQKIESITLRLHEVAASYTEYVFAKNYRRQVDFEKTLVERSEIYNLPIFEDCKMLESRLETVFRSASFRGNIIYTIAKISLNRRLAAAQQRQSLASGVAEVILSAPPPDALFSVYMDAFDERWSDIRDILIGIDANFCRRLSWSKGNAEELFDAVRQSPKFTLAKVKILENLHKDFLYVGLSTSLEPDGFSTHACAIEHFNTKVLPSLMALVSNVELRPQITNYPAKPRVSDPTLVDPTGIRFCGDASLEDVGRLIKLLCFKGFSQQRLTLIVHVYSGSFTHRLGIDGVNDIQIASGNFLCSAILSQIHNDSADVLRERVLFSAPVDRLLQDISILGVEVTAVILSSLHPSSDDLAKYTARKFVTVSRQVFYRPWQSMHVEAVELGEYSFQLPALAAFIKTTEEEAGGLVLFLGSQESFWIIDIVTNSRLVELVDWVRNHDQIQPLGSLPFDSDFLAELRYAVTTSLIHATP
jgi:hypothetical protein